MTAGAQDSWTRGQQPAAAGVYEVSPFKAVEMVSEATWDGSRWRYLTDGRECYVQNLAWRRPQQELAA